MARKKKTEASFEYKPTEGELRALRAMGPMQDESVIDRGILETFPFKYPESPTEIVHSTDEFTCLCPFTGLPDFASLTVEYVPSRLCIELRSFKFYLQCFRQVGIFHEHAVNKILEDLVKVLKPREMTVTGDFATRGGVVTTVSARYWKKR